MKILSPLSRVDEVAALIEAGADELYCGLIPPDWPYVAFSINRRQDPETQFHSFAELEAAVSLAHAHHTPVHLTINEHYYTEPQYPYLRDYVRRAADIGIDAFYLADVALLLAFGEWRIKVPVHLSTGGACFNSAAARFYQGLGAQRIILPRHLTVAEIRETVSRVPGLPFEVFILNAKCHNVDGLCTFHHQLNDVVEPALAKEYRNGCMANYEVSIASPVYSAEEMKKRLPQISLARQQFWKRVHIDTRPCGACALYDFTEMGISAVKIVGRKNSLEKKLTDIAFIRGCLDYLKHTHPDRDTYVKWTQQRYRETYQYPCRIYMCYYPSVNPSWNTPSLSLNTTT